MERYTAQAHQEAHVYTSPSLFVDSMTAHGDCYNSAIAMLCGFLLHSSLLRNASLCLLLGLSAPGWTELRAQPGRARPDPTQSDRFGVDLTGRRVEQLAPKGARVVVLFFAASDCPISNRYIPEITRLSRDLAPRGAAFWWVFPNPGDTAAVVREHQRQFSPGTDRETVLDTEQKLVRKARVSTTPEAAVFTVVGGTLREVYHGRVDDRYIAFGKERPQPAHHDLEDAIRAALDGKPVPQPAGRPVGCGIVPLTVAR